MSLVAGVPLDAPPAFIEPPSFVSRATAADPASLPVVNPSHGFTHTLRVTYPSAGVAHVVFQAVTVDEEIRPDRIYRHCRIEEESTLVCYFSAVELKSLRVAVSSFLEMLALATDTVAQFAHSEHAGEKLI